MNSEVAIEQSLYQKLYSCCAPAKLFKRKTVGHIRFPQGRLSEDLATCHLFFDNADKVVYSSYCGYYYRQHGSSIMHVFNARRMDALEWAKSIESFCSEKYPHIIKAAKCRIFNVAVHLLFDMSDNNIGGELANLEKILTREIRRTRWCVLFDIKARNRERVAAFCSFFGVSFLRKVWNNSMLRTVLTIIFIVVCLALSIIVLMQEGKSAGLGAISGAAESYWGKNKGRSMEGKLVMITRVLAIAFIVLAVVLNISRI